MTDSINAERQSFNDEQIVELYWQRDENALRATEDKYGKLLFKVAYNVLADKSDCEECKNDALLAIWNAIPPARPKSFVTFITQIMRYTAIDRYKQKKAKKRVPSELTVSIEELCNSLYSDDRADLHLEAEELSRLISSFVRGLSKKNRYIFVGRFYMADSIEAIADELGVSESGIYKALERIKKELKNYLARNGVHV